MRNVRVLDGIPDLVQDLENFQRKTLRTIRVKGFNTRNE